MTSTDVVRKKSKKRCTEHSYILGLPKWANTKDWQCRPWDTVMHGKIWYCRHIMVCSKCGRQDSYDGSNCPDRPEDDGTVELH